MKCTADEEAMKQRRPDRLKHCDFFMRDAPGMPDHMRRTFGLHATANLLTGFFQNSYYRAAWYMLRKAIENSWMEFSVTCHITWYRRFLKLSDEQIDERF